ncbi:hypothetical protein Poli38472_000233 [Pythium oligandrum]|uniref:Exonuclease 1 n=1 Tax=Pythium oligandrum TaxID=41045 RepID=A0A8K1CC25_PYTOL|nr:hypothetical protein Poli38472_000233 [Pythium oligandrum]|eukprot:TMW60191.1 hypothetical protein Poli38472_000233 [Pythium oligandrum]
MGIEGFLRQLKDAVEETHLRRYAGQTMVVDAFSWLHKACYGCAFDLATGRETDTYVRYMLRKVDLMKNCGIRDVILVFDGQRLPLKASTHEKRQHYKQENRKRALEHMAESRRLHGDAKKDEFSKAYQHFQKAVSITPEIVQNVQNALRQAMIPFVVAPFEADAQMVWMCKAGIASGIVTEDSDVFVYCMAAGVESPVLFKLDDGGVVQALSRRILHQKTANTTNAFLKKIHCLATGEKDATRMFVQFCALSGCDFLDSLPNMGIVTALKHIFNFRGAPGALRVQRILAKLRSSNVQVPSDFHERFQQTESIFFHHIIFNPVTASCEFLIDDAHANCFPDVFDRVLSSMGMTHGAQDLHTHQLASSKSFLGQVPPRGDMIAMYNGDLCPRTRQRTDSSSTAPKPSTSQAKEALPRSESDNVIEIQDEENEGFVQRKKPKAPAPVVDPAAQARKQEMREVQRDASMRSLLNAYAHCTSSAVEKEEVKATTKLLEQVTQAPEPSKPSSAPIARSTVFSIKELAERHSRSVISKTIAVQKPQGQTPEPTSLKRRLPPPTPLIKAKQMRRTSTSPQAGRTTLLQFFQKQN